MFSRYITIEYLYYYIKQWIFITAGRHNTALKKTVGEMNFQSGARSDVRETGNKARSFQLIRDGTKIRLKVDTQEKTKHVYSFLKDPVPISEIDLGNLSYFTGRVQLYRSSRS